MMPGLPQHQVNGVVFLLSLQKLAVPEYGKLVLKLPGLEPELFGQILSRGLPPGLYKLVYSLLQICQAFCSRQAVALSEDQLRPLPPGVADLDPLSGIHVAVFAKGLPLGDETIVLRHIAAAALALNCAFFRHMHWLWNLWHI